MCAICGCAPREGGALGPASPGHSCGHSHDHDHPHAPGHGHGHEHLHPHGHEHAHKKDDSLSHPQSHEESSAQRGTKPESEEARKAKLIHFEAELLAENDRIAAENRSWLGAREAVAVNLIGSPGSGKTTLLERTIEFLRPELPISVLEGDQETELDAQRIRQAGVPVLQINTGSGCHLNARMVGAKMREINPAQRSLLFVENVGNLVCPALFDIGERAKVLVMSLTEGEEKPLKYPAIFRAAEILVLNKVDLLPYLNVDLEACLANVRSVNPSMRIFPASATSGIGLDDYFEWLRRLVEEKEAARDSGGAG